MNSPLLRTLDLRGFSGSTAELKARLPRLQQQNTATVQEATEQLLHAVRTQGWSAIRKYTEKFDGVPLTAAKVTEAQLAEAAEQLDPEVRAALEESIRRARQVAAEQLPADVTSTLAPGSTVTLSWKPVDRVGVYVPGGLAVYPSSVVMNVVPAQAASVPSLALFSPPQKEFGGLPHPTILAAAHLLGVQDVYAVGGALAVAAMAYGVPADSQADLLEPVSLITGPGNIFVATAKRLVKGAVGIDSEAGPTEIAIVADAQAPVQLVAADLISQAEHDPNAAAVLVTDSPELADAVVTEVAAQVKRTKHHERVQAALSGEQSGIILVDDVPAALTVADAYAAEHLEILTANAGADAAQINNAGAIFLGPDSPVSLGDYCAGSNHVLPTSGTAAFSAGLGVFSFLKAVQVINYDAEGLASVAQHISALSSAEDLPAHGDAVAARFGGRD